MPSDLPAQLTAARTARELTQLQAAIAAGVDPTTWSRWERGISSPEERFWAGIEKAVGLRIEMRASVSHPGRRARK